MSRGQAPAVAAFKLRNAIIARGSFENLHGWTTFCSLSNVLDVPWKPCWAWRPLGVSYIFHCSYLFRNRSSRLVVSGPRNKVRKGSRQISSVTSEERVALVVRFWWSEAMGWWWIARFCRDGRFGDCLCETLRTAFFSSQGVSASSFALTIKYPTGTFNERRNPTV